MNKSTPIFVAGHRGLIGSAFMRRLAAERYANVLTAARAELDLTRRTEVDKFFDRTKPEIVVLAAGKVGGILENLSYPADFINANLSIQLNVLQAAQRTGVKKLLFFGSSCMYPRECPQPMAESMLLSGKPEETSLPYAISKLAGVHMCLAYNRQFKETRFIPVIPNSAYGPNDDFDPRSSHVLSALIKKFHEAKESRQESVELWGTGAPRREFVHADDIADACYLLLQTQLETNDLPINIGVGIDYSIKELAEITAKLVGYRGSIKWDTAKPDGAPRKLLDSSRLAGLGWKPKVNFTEGLRQTYQWYLQNQKEVERDQV